MRAVEGTRVWLRVVAVLLLLGSVRAAARAAGPPEEEAQPQPESPPRRWPVFFDVQWDDGVVYEAGRRFRAPGPEAMHLFREDTLVTGRAGLQLQLDAGVFASTGGLSVPGPRADVRRGYVSFAGEVRTRWPVQYKVKLGANQGRIYVDSAWLALADLPHDLRLQVGQYDPPYSLENTTSSDALAFLELAQPVDAFVPGTKAGIGLSQGGGTRRVAWSFGYYASTQAPDVQNETRSPAWLVGRVTWVPAWLDEPADDRLVHLGLGMAYVVSSGAQVRYTARPETRLLPDVLDTGDIDASQTWEQEAELAFVRGRWRVQGEYLGSEVDARGGSRLYWGVYGLASYMLTGEHYPYDRAAGCFDMVVPASPVSPRAGRWRGAWEVAVRHSYLDLHGGGRDHALSLGVNWYWSRHLRLMLDYGVTLTRGLPHDGSIDVFQTRLQVVY